MNELDRNRAVSTTASRWISSKQHRALAYVRDATSMAGEEIRGEVVKSAAVIRGAEYLGREVLSSLGSLRRHEERMAADDPIIADEYAAIRRTVLAVSLDEIERFSRRAQ